MKKYIRNDVQSRGTIDYSKNDRHTPYLLVNLIHIYHFVYYTMRYCLFNNAFN